MTCPRRSGQKRWVVALRSSRPVGKMLHGHALQKVRDANQGNIVALARLLPIPRARSGCATEVCKNPSLDGLWIYSVTFC